MKRYRIVYCKTWPLTTWTNTKEEAKLKAEMLRKIGYDVSVWEYDKEKAKLTNI